VRTTSARDCADVRAGVEAGDQVCTRANRFRRPRDAPGPAAHACPQASCGEPGRDRNGATPVHLLPASVPANGPRGSHWPVREGRLAVVGCSVRSRVAPTPTVDVHRPHRPLASQGHHEHMARWHSPACASGTDAQNSGRTCRTSQRAPAGMGPHEAPARAEAPADCDESLVLSAPPQPNYSRSNSVTRQKHASNIIYN
jgi:hypothetical protein